MQSNSRQSAERVPSWILVALAVAVGLGLTCAAVLGADKALRDQARSEFNRRADTFESEVAHRLGLVEALLRGERSAFEVAGHMDDADVERFLRTRNLDAEVPGVLGIGVLEPRSTARSEKVRGAYVLRSVHPVARNEGAAGVDVTATEAGRAVVAAATDGGTTEMSAPMRLHDPQHRLGWTLLMPVYSRPSESVEERRARIAGFAYAALVADELISPVSELLGNSVRLRVFDGTLDDGRLMYDSHAGRALPLSPRQTVRPILFANRLLTLELVSDRSLLSQAGSLIPWAIGLGGTLLSLLLGLSAWLLISGKRRATAVAEQMTADLRRMAGVVERTTSGIFTADPQGRITGANHGFEELVGRSQRTLIQRHLADVLGDLEDVGPDGPTLTADNLPAGLGRRLELHGRRLDGSRFWADVEVQVVRNEAGTSEGFMGVAVDITRRKEAELSLQANEHLLRAVADNIPAQVSYWTARRKCLFANRSFCEAFALTADSVQGAILGEGKLGGEAYALLRPHVEAALAGQARLAELTITQADGRTATWMVNCVPDPRAGGLFLLASDVTDLHRARELALSASQAKSRFLSSMSHEIRTPMNAIAGMLALLQETRLDSRQKDYADKAEGATRTLLALVNGVLDLSKIEAGKMELDPAPFSLPVLVRDLAALLTVGLGSKPLQVRWDIDPDLPATLVGDEMRLRQILINLGGNAVKFTARGEVVVDMRMLERRGQQVRLRVSVSDTGIGISEQEQELLFDDYGQANKTIAKSFGGTGLGLSICRKLVALMGGSLRLSSTPGVGSRFWFEIVLGVAQEGDALAGRDSLAARVRPLDGLRLLVVEDNLVNQQIAMELLERQGARVTVSGDGAQAIARLRRGDTFDLVLMDLQMPVMGGLEATRAIRQDLHLTSLPIVAMTANAMAQDRNECLAAGMDDHVAKPFVVTHLVTTILGLVQNHRPGATQLSDSAQRDVAVFDPQDAIDRLGDVDLFRRMVPIFRASLQEAGQRLEASHLPDEDMARLMHTIKGMAATMGANHLAQAASDSEQRLRTGGADAEAVESIHVVRAAVGATLRVLARIDGDDETAAAHRAAAAAT